MGYGNFCARGVCSTIAMKPNQKQSEVGLLKDGSIVIQLGQLNHPHFCSLTILNHNEQKVNTDYTAVSLFKRES